MRAIPGPDFELVPQRVEHAAAMFEVLSDPALYTIEGSPPESLAALQERYARLESARSPDGRELWLNWVIRLPSSQLVGFVQATVRGDASAAIAYVLGRAHWGRGLASAAVTCLMRELSVQYGVTWCSAVVKCRNQRSLRLLERLGFTPDQTALRERLAVLPDEILLTRAAA